MKVKLFTLIFFILLIISCFSVKTYAYTEIPKYPIIAEKDVANFNDFDETGALSYSGSVDLNQEGQYSLYYKDYNNKNISRDVIVASAENIQKGIAYTSEFTEIYKNKRIGLDGKIVKCDNESYFSYINQESTKKYALISFNDSKDEYTQEYEDIMIKDMIVYNDCAYVLYEYKKTNLNKIGIMILNKYCEAIRLMNYTSNKEEEAIGLYSKKNNMYIIFNTTSNTGVIERSESTKAGVLMEINTVSLRKENQIKISNNNDSYIIDFLSTDDKLYLLCSFSGTEGDYYNTYNRSYSGRMIVEFGNYISQIASISYEYDNDNIVLSENGFYIIEKDAYNKTYLDIKLNNYKQVSATKTFSFKKDPNTKTITFGIYLDKLIIVENDADIICKVSIINEVDLSLYNLSFYSINYHIDKIISDQNDIYLYTYFDNIYVSKLYIFSYNKKDVTDNTNKIKYEDIDIYTNFKKEEASKENINYQDLKYGSYQQKKLAYTGNVKIIYNVKLNVPLKINIIDNQIYDINTRIYSNAKMYLNDMPIENGYNVDKVGKYQLIIYDASSKASTFNIEIRDLCEKEYTNDKLEDNKQTNYMMYEESNNYLSKATYDVSLYENKESFKYALVFILFISSLLCFFTYKKVVKRGKKQ